MTHTERVVACINHQEPDRVPVYPVVGGCLRGLVGATYEEWSKDADLCARSFIEGQKKYDLDCVVTLIDLSIECTAWGQELIFPENEAAHPDYSKVVIPDEDSYGVIKKVDYRNCERMMMHIDVCKKIVEASKGEYPVVAFVFGPLGTLSMLRNQQEMYIDCIECPDEVKAAAREVTETLKEYSQALLDVGVDGIMYDTLFSSGSIMAKEMWDELEGDLVQELAEMVHAQGKMVMIHNCGGKIYLDAQIERMHPEAISLLYPADDCMDFVETKAKYGDKTTLIGCVAPTTAALGTDEAWEKECKENIDMMAKGGGYVLATGCEYPANADHHHLEMMVDIAKTYGVYNK